MKLVRSVNILFGSRNTLNFLKFVTKFSSV